MNPVVAVLGSALAASIGFALLRKFVSGGRCRHVVNLSGKTAVITGANVGIGLETAKELAKMGAHVIVACRDQRKAIAAVREIKDYAHHNRVESVELDLANLMSVRHCAEQLKKRHTPIHLLINNAGVMCPPFTITRDGFELQMGVNFVGHFLFTMLLLDSLDPHARIVNVSSRAHMHSRGVIDWEFQNNPIKNKELYRPMHHYGQSKLANVLFTYELQRRLQEREETRGITIHALHPGVVHTQLARDFSLPVRMMLWPIAKLFFKTPLQGAQTTLYAAVAPELEGIGGQYLSDCKRISSHPASYNRELASQLWTFGLRATGLE